MQTVAGEGLSRGCGWAVKPTAAPVPPAPHTQTGEGSIASAVHCWPTLAGDGWGPRAMLSVKNPSFCPPYRLLSGKFVLGH